MPKYQIRTSFDSSGLAPWTFEADDPEAVRREAIGYLGRFLKELDGAFWDRGELQFWIEDEANLLVIQLDVFGVFALGSPTGLHEPIGPALAVGPTRLGTPHTDSLGLDRLSRQRLPRP